MRHLANDAVRAAQSPAYEREFARWRLREARRATLDFEVVAEPWVPLRPRSR